MASGAEPVVRNARHDDMVAICWSTSFTSTPNIGAVDWGRSSLMLS
jgi:hypothetical protein